MKYSYLFAGLILVLSACNYFSRKDSGNTAFLEFQEQFKPVQIAAGDTFDTSDLTFGTHRLNASSTTTLADSLIRAVIREKTLQRAQYDPEQIHYALGRFAYSDTVEGYLIGAYQDDQSFSTHMFLYHPKWKSFWKTLSLSYTVGGGGFLSKRKAWFTDLNADGVPDVVYRKDEIYNSPEQSSFVDTLYSVVWTGKRFDEFPVTDMETMKKRFPFTVIY